MNPEPLTPFIKPIAGVAAAGASYIAETVTPAVPGVPEWVTALGLPVAFLVAVIYALVTTHRAYREVVAGRQQDAEKTSVRLEAIIEKGNESRERLIRATDQQTAEFAKLADELKNRPCQLRKHETV